MSQGRLHFGKFSHNFYPGQDGNMKNYLYMFLLLSLIIPVSTNAEDFLGAPLVPGGTIIQKTEKQLELKTELSHAEVMAFYKEALKSLKDRKFREWKEATYIEDDGNLTWHSITISKEDKEGTTIVVMKDSWTWIIGTLVLRYIGVFVVLLFLLLGMIVSGAIISRSVKRREAKAG
jgi:hypothetical protein